MAYDDISLECVDCGCTFEFTAGEQEFYATKGLVNSPKRCKDCRSNKKRMNNRGGGSQRRLYDVVCSACGVDTKVPFRPSEEKPVYCKECFDKASA